MSQAERHTVPEREFDWGAAYQKLAKLRVDIDEVHRPPPERIRQILRERSAVLAAPRTAARPTAVTRLVTFRRRGQRWAIDADQLQEVIDVANPTPLPGLPAIYIGLVHHRGEVYPVVDIALLFGIGSGEPGDHLKALIVSDGAAAVAIGADAIEGHTQIDSASIAQMAEGAATHQAMQGLTPDLAIVFDAHRMLADARLVVNEQPATPSRNEGEK
jgi:purine-binding chemotaxis protein CheW